MGRSRAEGPDAEQSYAFRYLPGPDAVPLVLLHGSNGDERDLLRLASAIRPTAARLAVRGDVDLDPGHAFFRRFPDRRIDVEDLRTRARRLARFIEHAADRFGWRATPLALGYSNGAIMAAALLIESPRTLAGAILLRPMLPFEPEPQVALTGKRVLVIDGTDDHRRDPGDGLRVRDALRRAGAEVRRETSSSGHAHGLDDVTRAGAWIGRPPTEG